MPLITTLPIVLADATPVDHTFTYHHQDVQKPLAGVYTSSLLTDDNPEMLKVEHVTTKAGRKRSLAQLSFTDNVGTEEVPNYQPVVLNFTVSSPSGADSAVVAGSIAMMAALLAKPGFAAGFVGQYIS